MEAQAFWQMFKARGLTFFSGVPDSTFQKAYNLMVQDPEIRYIPAVREDVALGVASAAYFTGRLGGVMMQNSGIGNIVNPLTSFSLMYQIPVLLVVGWRGYGGPPNDAPEHWIMGVKTPQIFDLLDIPYAVLESDQPEPGLDQLLAVIEERSIPGALLVRTGVIQ
ncbi:MAG: thiamine pyrophosphate-binding protein [bacterium]|nr:thiamine pyrophosphate-binding protein [bacterium]